MCCVEKAKADGCPLSVTICCALPRHVSVQRFYKASLSDRFYDCGKERPLQGITYTGSFERTAFGWQGGHTKNKNKMLSDSSM